MRVLTTIMAHGDARASETFYRHLPFWKAHRYPLLVMCPDDSMIQTDLPMLTIGRKSHHDPEANRRMRLLLRTLSHTTFDWHLIYEYDALCISAAIPAEIFEQPGLWANWFNCDKPACSTFKARSFCHPPLIVDRDTLGRIVRASEQVLDREEGGFWDRWLGRVCEQDREITVRSLGKLGFAENTIEPAMTNRALHAAASGAVLFHGMKHGCVLQSLLDVSPTEKTFYLACS